MLKKHKVKSFSSTAYYQQKSLDVDWFEEEDAYPANPEDGYGWEKLFSERMYRHFRVLNLDTKVARYHNIYGPWVHLMVVVKNLLSPLCRKNCSSKNQ